MSPSLILDEITIPPEIYEMKKDWFCIMSKKSFYDLTNELISHINSGKFDT